MKTCKVCKIEKQLDDFYKSKSGRLGRMARCKLCVLKEMRIAYAENPEPKKIQSAAWKAANPGATYANIKKNRALDPEKHNAENREYRRLHPDKELQWARKWRSNNRPTARAAGARRTAAKLRSIPAWANHAKIKAIYAEADRLTRETGIIHEVDHIYPLQSKVMCGLHWEANLQILPRSENRSKSNRRWPKQHPMVPVQSLNLSTMALI